MEFLGHPDMIPPLYSEIPDQKPVKLNKKDEKPKDKDYQHDKYVPIYTYAVPCKVCELVSVASLFKIKCLTLASISKGW